MGKNKQSRGSSRKSKSTAYEHVHTHNPKAHNSDERRLEALKNVQISRLTKQVERLKQSLSNFVPVSESNKVQKKDPLFFLKGAARPAQEFYRQPGLTDEPMPRDILQEYHGRLYDHCESKKLLEAMLTLGIHLHNVGSKTKQAIQVFNEILEHDPVDHLCVRHHLLRCYLDRSDALSARTLLDRFPTDYSSCFMYTRALVEYISCTLNEEGSTDEIRNSALLEAYEKNPYTFFVICEHETFKDVIQHTDKIQTPTIEGSIEDAFLFYDIDLVIWKETDGAIEWVQQFSTENNLQPPVTQTMLMSNIADSNDNTHSDNVLLSKSSSTSSTTNTMNNNYNQNNKNNSIINSNDKSVNRNLDSSDSDQMTAVDQQKMFMGMFQTAIEMIAMN